MGAIGAAFDEEFDAAVDDDVKLMESEFIVDAEKDELVDC